MEIHRGPCPSLLAGSSPSTICQCSEGSSNGELRMGSGVSYPLMVKERRPLIQAAYLTTLNSAASSTASRICSTVDMTGSSREYSVQFSQSRTGRFLITTMDRSLCLNGKSAVAVCICPPQTRHLMGSSRFSILVPTHALCLRVIIGCGLIRLPRRLGFLGHSDHPLPTGSNNPVEGYLVSSKKSSGDVRLSAEKTLWDCSRVMLALS